MTQPQFITTALQPGPANPHQQVPMVHANTQNNHTTLVIMSAYYGSQMLTSTMTGFTQLMDIYTATGTLTEGQVYTALWPETGLLNQAATIFGPEVVSYTPGRNVFTIRVGAGQQCVNMKQMQRIAHALAVLDDTALARRAVYLICATHMSNLLLLGALHDDTSTDDDEIHLITYARTLHSYVPDIDEQLAQIATAQHRPMRHGVTAQYHHTSTSTQHSAKAATLPAYIGRDGGICTDTTMLYHGDEHTSSQPAVDRVITTNPVVLRNIVVDDDLSTAPTMVSNRPNTTVELRTVLAATDTVVPV